MYDKYVNRLATGTRLAMRELELDKNAGFPTLDTNNGNYFLRPDYTPNEWRYFQWIGFLTGRLWLLADLTKDDELAGYARTICERIEPILSKGPVTNENAGFDIFYTFCVGYNLTGDAWFKDAALRALSQYTKAFRPELGLFLCDIDANEVVIDTAGPLMEFYWSQQWVPENGARLKQHMETVLNVGLVRPDGSCMQGAEFDLKTNEFHRFYARQSHTGDSRWTRAQAWGFHTHTNGAEATGSPQFLEVATRTAQYFWDRLPESMVNEYDYDDPRHGSIPLDTCSSAMAANTFLRLSRLDTPDMQPVWRERAEKILARLLPDHMTVGGTMLHGSWGNVKVSRGIGRFPLEDVMPYGNYFIVEALWRANRDDWTGMTLTPS